MNIDFGKTSKDYGSHRKGFPQSFFERIDGLGILDGAESLLDIGTGTGTLARGFAAKGLSVTGIDPSEEIMIEAENSSLLKKLNIHYQKGYAESLSFPDDSFDIITAGQCWHWFDREKAAKEVYRVCKDKGYLIIAHFDWIPIPGNIVEMTEKLILNYNPEWNMDGGSGIYPQWFRDVSIGGFTDIESFTYDTMETYSKEAWRGRIRASAGISASLCLDDVKRFDNELKESLNKVEGENLNIPHRVFALICSVEKQL